MKRNIIALLVVVMVLCCCLTLAACNNKTNVLDNYIFEMDGTTVSDDFVLPATIGGEAAEWKSEGTAIQLEKRESDWLAKVTLPETGLVDVNLTVTVKKSSKSYTVRVKALDVYDFMNSYVFPKDKATIVDNFDLETEFAYKGKTATIAWSVDEDYELYIKVINNGKTLQVTPQGNQTPVKVKATFTYGGVSASQSYRMTVYKTMEGLELVNYWYTNTGVSIDMSGYVVLIGTAYSSSYNNVTLYMVNDDFTAGYYLYRVETTDEHAAKLAPGVHITVTGTTNTNYNGLVETNAGGKLVVDDDVAPIDVNAHVKAIDQEVIGNLPATVYHESRLVSLTNWKVDSVAEEADKKTGDNYTLMVLTKGGAKVSVRVSKYMEGAYATKADDATWTAINALTTTYPVDSMVNVTGILSRYIGKNTVGDGWQIMPLSASAVTASGQEEDAADTVYAGKKVAAAIAKVNEKLVEDKINDKEGKTVRIKTQKEFALETAVDGVEISYKIVGKSNAIVLDGGKMTVTPGNPETATILATYKSGEFKSIQFFFVESLIPTAASMLDDLKDELKDPIKAVTDLPTVEGATIEWKVVSGKDSIQIKNGQLIPTLKENDVRTIINATLTYNGVTRNKDYVVVVKAGKGAVAVNAPFEEGKGYYLATNQKKLGKTLYAINKLDGNFLTTTDDYTKADKIYVEKEGEGYRVYFVNKDVKSYISYKIDKNKDNVDTAYITLVKENAVVWNWDSKNNCFSTKIKVGETENTYYFGTYNDFTTLSLSNVSYVSSSFPSFLANIEFVPLTENAVTYQVSNKDSATVTLSTDKTFDGQNITFTVQVANEYRLVKVNVNGKEVKATDGVYTVKASGATKISVKTTSTKQYQYAPEKVTTMTAGTYKFYMDTTVEGGGVLYATGAVNSKGALLTTADPTKAADIVVEAVADKENTYTLKIGDKYLVGYKNGTFNNIKLDEAAGEWTWNETIKSFTCVIGKDTFFFGTYLNTSKDTVGDTMALSKVSFVTGDNAKNIGKTQFIGYACTLKAAE